jgi:RNA polymerase sigma factor (sigma-70 family)
MDDRDLLRRYVQRGEEQAFGELVRRHQEWVYSVCWRRLGNEELARDATQVVFLALARQARQLVKHETIAGWLHRVSRYTALKFRRDEERRMRRERQANAMRTRQHVPQPEPGENWAVTEKVLEQALDALRAPDREAILLRFYRKLSHAQVGDTLKISEEAAKKRVTRAVERLRHALGVRGVRATDAGISAAMLAHGAMPAPATVAAGLDSIVKGAVSTKIQTLTQGVLQMMGHVKMAVMAGWIVTALMVVSAVAVPLVHAGFTTQPAPISTPVVTPGTPLIEAEQKELAALQDVLKNIDQEMQIVSLTPEVLATRLQWQRRLAKVQMQLANGLAARLKVAEDWLASTQAFDKRMQQLALVNAGPAALAEASAYVAEAQVIIERVKNGENGDVGL